MLLAIPRRAPYPFAVFVAGLCACSRESAPLTQGSAKAPASTPSVAPTPSPEPAPTITALSEGEVRAVLDRWLAAQNAGDFAAYESLYAERFAGLKRVGLRSERFDRKGWIRDRKRMFEKPMKVEASAVAITSTQVAGTIRFVQTWSSGKFQDRGEKMLHVVRDAGGLHIASEAMLSSTIEKSVREDPLETEDFRMVLHTPSKYVVLSEAGSDAQAVGKAQLASADYSQMAVIKAPRPNAIPQDVLAVRGKPLALFGSAGEVCKARVGAVSLMRRLTPHWNTRQIWNGTAHMNGEDQPPVPRGLVATEGWNDGGSTTLIVGALEAISGDCSTAFWARSIDRPAPIVFSRQALDPKLAALAERTVRALPAYAKIALEYSAYARDIDPEAARALPPFWETFDGAKPTYDLWTHGQRKLLRFDAGVGGCGDFGADLWALFEVDGDKLVLLTRPGSDAEPDDFWLESIVDANGDGLLELLGSVWNSNHAETNVLLRGTTNGVMQVVDLSPPYHDCGC